MMRCCNWLSKTSSALAVLAAAACSASPAGSTPGAADSAPESSPECTNTPPCDGAQTDKDGRPAVCVQTVDADIVDEQGAPVAGFHAQVCGSNVCIAAKSDPQGHLHFVACKNMSAPSFELPGKSRYVSYAIPIDRPVTAMGPFALVPLGAGAGAMQSAEGKDATYASGGAVLVVRSGTEVQVNGIDHPEPDDQVFRASHLDEDSAPGLLESSPSLTLFYGLAPGGTRLSQPAALTLPNWNQWPAGAEAEFFVQGQDPVTGGPSQWASAGVGRVSDDGKTVSGGVTYLGLVGARLKSEN